MGRLTDKAVSVEQDFSQGKLLSLIIDIAKTLDNFTEAKEEAKPIIKERKK